MPKQPQISQSTSRARSVSRSRRRGRRFTPETEGLDPETLVEHGNANTDSQDLFQQQSERLSDPHLQSAQRQSLASHLGRKHGNLQLSRLLNRQANSASPSFELQRQDTTDPEQVARQAFIARGLMPDEAGLDMQSATGIGGFNARYDPANSELLIRLRVGINFRSSITVLDEATGAIGPATPDFATTAINLTTDFPDPAARVAEVRSRWNWSESQENQWMQDYGNVASSAWGDQHYFKSSRWDDVFANVRVQLDVHRGHQANDHCKATVFKVPNGFSGGPGAVVNSTGGNATASTGTFTSADIGGRFNFLDHELYYPEGATRVEQAIAQDGTNANTYLDNLIATFQRGTPTGGVPINITGHASATGNPAFNQQISQRRANNVAQYLQSHGQMIAGYRITAVGVGDEGAAADESWRRADIRVGEGGGQHTMVHETGHMLGLGDEYVVAGQVTSGTGGTVGTPTAHGALSAAMGGGVQGSVYENNDNIMSLGNVVRPQHYATFHEALNRVTAPESFVYGGPGQAPTIIPDLIPTGGTSEPETMVA